MLNTRSTILLLICLAGYACLPRSETLDRRTSQSENSEVGSTSSSNADATGQDSKTPSSEADGLSDEEYRIADFGKFRFDYSVPYSKRGYTDLAPEPTGDTILQVTRIDRSTKVLIEWAYANSNRKILLVATKPMDGQKTPKVYETLATVHAGDARTTDAGSMELDLKDLEKGEYEFVMIARLKDSFEARSQVVVVYE